MHEGITKALNIITTIAVAVVVFATVAVVAPRIFGIYPYAVLSGSMEPEYPTGSLIYSRETDTSTLAEGDVITYMISRDATVTHRITDIVEDEKGQIRYQTKGDANDQPDTKLVHPDNVIGVPVLCVPYAGYILNAATTPPGSFLLLSLMALVIMFMFLPDIFSKDDTEQQIIAENGISNFGERTAESSNAFGKNTGFEVPRGPAAYGQGQYPAAPGYYPAAPQHSQAYQQVAMPRQAPVAQNSWNSPMPQCAQTPVQEPAYQAFAASPASHLSPEECALMAQRELARRAAARAAQNQNANYQGAGVKHNAN